MKKRGREQMETSRDYRRVVGLWDYENARVRSGFNVAMIVPTIRSIIKEHRNCYRGHLSLEAVVSDSTDSSKIDHRVYQALTGEPTIDVTDLETPRQAQVSDDYIYGKMKDLENTEEPILLVLIAGDSGYVEYLIRLRNSRRPIHIYLICPPGATAVAMEAFEAEGRMCWSEFLRRCEQDQRFGGGYGGGGGGGGGGGPPGGSGGGRKGGSGGHSGDRSSRPSSSKANRSILYKRLMTGAGLLKKALLEDPVLSASLFNKFTPLPDRTEKLASSLKFPLKKLFVVDGSTRSSHSNAYLYGFFKNKRIVLYDALIQQCKNEDGIVAVIAHELGHWKLNHIAYSFIAVQILAQFGGYALVRISTDLFRSFGFDTQPVLIFLTSETS